MPLFNRFPYTNFHELNLNWILEQIPIVKKYRDETEELHDDTKVLHDNTKVLHDNVVEQHKEITAEITQGKKDISDLTTTGKHEISDLTDESKHAITDLTNSGKNELNNIITTGTNQLDTLIDTGKADIKTLTDKGKTDIQTLTDSGKSTIETATTTGKAEITNTVTDGKAQIATAKDGALEAIGTAKDSATTTIKNLESSATSAITAKGDLYLHKIEDEGTKQTKAVTDEGTTQITNITQLGDTYKTEMTTLKNEAQTSADNAKASETKAQEYAETAKTLKPMYWGGDIDNLHNSSNVVDDCLNFANLKSTLRYSNLRILTNALHSPDSSKEWQCKINFDSDSSMDLLAWNADGEMYVGSFKTPYKTITWNKTVNLDEIYAEIADIQKGAWLSSGGPYIKTKEELRNAILDGISNFQITLENEIDMPEYYNFTTRRTSRGQTWCKVINPSTLIGITSEIGMAIGKIDTDYSILWYSLPNIPRPIVNYVDVPITSIIANTKENSYTDAVTFNNLKVKFNKFNKMLKIHGNISITIPENVDSVKLVIFYTCPYPSGILTFVLNEAFIFVKLQGSNTGTIATIDTRSDTTSFNLSINYPLPVDTATNFTLDATIPID